MNINKMKVKILGFRSHIDSEYEISDGSIVLLKGPSGSGKTTILQALFWCLYGSLRNVYNNSGHVNKCMVSLEMQSYAIIRQKKPEKLTVRIGNQEYEDDVAQKIIEQTYGQKEYWQTCCYIQQSHRCQLLSGSNVERMELLNALSFTGEDLGSYLEKIENELKIISAKYQSGEQNFMKDYQIFVDDINRDPIKNVDGNLENHEIKLVEDQAKLKILEKQRLEQRDLQGRRSSLMTTLSELKQRQSDIPDISSQEIEEKQQQLLQVRESMVRIADINKKKQLFDVCERHIDNVRSSLYKINHDWELNRNIYMHLTERDIYQIENIASQRNKNLNVCQQVGCEYDEEIISKTKLRIMDEIEQLRNISVDLSKVKDLLSLENLYLHDKNEIENLDRLINDSECKRDDMRMVLDNLSIDNIEELIKMERDKSEHVKHLKRSKEGLPCPHCGKLVKISLGCKLEPIDMDGVTDDQISEASHSLDDIISRLKIAKDMKQKQDSLGQQLLGTERQLNLLGVKRDDKIKHQDEIKDRIKLIPRPIIDVTMSTEMVLTKIKSLTLTLNTVMSVTVIDNPKCNPDIAKLIFKLKTFEDEREQFKIPNIIEPVIDEGKISAELNRMTRDYHTKNAIVAQTKVILDNLVEINANINDLIEISYGETKLVVESVILKISQLKYLKSMELRRLKLETSRTELVSLNDDLMALSNLKHKALEVECKQLQATVDAINSALSEILPMLFEDPITVVISLFKELKTGNRIKPYVNLAIHYRGADYDNVNQLSGGEGDRISLALILSLNRVSSSPFLFLDECLASIDGPLKEASLKAIRVCVGGSKIVICVSHDDIEGHYDEVITL